MKTNAIIRIIIWSIALVLLSGLLGVGLYRSEHNHTEAVLAATEPALVIDTGSAAPWDARTNSCDVEATITADALNVRSTPTSDSSAVGMLKKGDIVSINQGIQIGSQSEMWLSIYAPMKGWIKAEYVDSLEGIEFYGSEALRTWTDDSGSASSTPATVTEEVNIRTAPSEDATVIGILYSGVPVTIGRQENVGGELWAHISAPQSGWVMAKYLNTAQAGTAPQAPAEGISLDPRQIREIDIEWAAGNITIKPADVDTIQLSEAAHAESKHAMIWKQNNDKLTIRFSENVHFDFNFGISINDVVAKDLTILVPMGWECDSLEIDAASATVDVKNLVIKEVDFDGASGTCNFVNCVVSELDLDTASGDIYFTGSLDVLDCDAASASVFAVFDNVPSRIDMDSMSGDLDITLPSNAGFTVSMDALSSDFVSDFGYSQNREGYYRGDGKCKITMDAMSGDLYLREYKDADAAPEAATAP